MATATVLTDSFGKLTSINSSIKTTGGASVWMKPLDIVNELQPLNMNGDVHGYCVGDNRISIVIPEYNASSPDALAKLSIACYDLWERGANVEAVGFWLDTNTNRLYVDSITLVPELGTALNMAAHRGELAIWDNDLKREIRLN
jgi:hypothetical protein